MIRNKLIQLTLSERKKIYLVMAFVSLIFLFLAIWQVRPVIVEPSAPLGLISYLPFTYWIGIFILLLVSIFAFIDKRLQSDGIFFVILIAMVFLLPGVESFIHQNAGLSNDYYPASEVYTLIATHHIDIANPPTLASYYSWPLMHFITAAIIKTTYIDLGSLLKYGPLVCMIFFICITYSIGKRLELTSKQCFLLSILALASWLPSYAGTFSPRSISVFIYLLILMFVIIYKKMDTAEIVIIIILFVALMLMHGLSTLALFPGLVLVSIYKKDFRYLLIFVVIFSAWYVFELVPTFSLGVKEYLLRPFTSIFQVAKWQTNPVPSSSSKALLRYSQLTYIFSYAALMVGSIFIFWLKKIKSIQSQYSVLLFLWACGCTILFFGGYGEDLYRVYIFCIVPAAAIIVINYSSRKLLIPLLSIFVILFPLLNFGGWAASGQVLTTELAGNKFLALHIKPKDYFFVFPGGPQLMGYYDPSLFNTAGRTSIDFTQFANQVDLTKINNFQYVITSKQGSDRWIFYWNKDPYASWQNTNDGKNTLLIYNNDFFQIYQNIYGGK